ncbi:hypothetical protein H9Y05_10495 [Crocinitomicaceae bacterium CZZ-1]|uniref:Uncharacterized protein n=1 Tax=Taishania pollutisoli TaxID=2766479 RepID=A0A8J6PJR4_9FLAO|nr:hypothetical protein [Taishania pollutisoli]MBC9812899.1 hypothetical protein [Taishania pollutisoli]
MDEEQKLLIELLKEAVEDVYREKPFLFESYEGIREGLEQAFVFRTGIYLEQKIKGSIGSLGEEYEELRLDCEYNKNHGGKKVTFNFPNGIKPDIILHKRDCNEKNKLVVEFKGWWNKDITKDIQKLKDLTKPNGGYEYLIGVWVKVTANKNRIEYKYFINGKEVDINGENTLIDSIEIGIKNTLEFSGAMLLPSFSIYVYEIITEEKVYFYIGMTGDPFYPSARSAIHRLSGHFEKLDRSTQNQVHKALTELNIDLNNTTIKLHHFPITGYEEWQGSKQHQFINDIRKSKEYQDSDERKKYEAYKRKQQEIAAFESYLIKNKRNLGNRLLNKTSDSSKNFETPEYLKEIEKAINEIVI